MRFIVLFTLTFGIATSAAGQMKIDSEPSGSRIILNGDTLNHRTPHLLKNIHAGTHRLVVYKQYPDSLVKEIKTVELKSATDTLNLQFKLKKSETALRISSFPSHAEVWIDRNPDLNILPYRYTPSLITEIEGGIHKIALRKTGYLDTLINIRIHPYEMNYFTVKLKSASDDYIMEQEIFERKRDARKTGKYIIGWSLLPALTGLWCYYESWNYFYKTRDIQKDISQSLITQGENYEHLRQDFRNSKKQTADYEAKAIRLALLTTLSLGAGFYLYF
jgi:hypothetical protein